MKQKIFNGYESYKKLNDILKDHSPKKIFFVTGKKSYIISGAECLLRDIINKYKFVIFNDFRNNPDIVDVKKGVDFFKAEGCDMIIAIGGGSVIDMAKSISILENNEDDFINFVNDKGKLKSRRIASVIIPTTAGTGSESTHFSVIYKDKTKYSLVHDSILPDYAILDPIFTKTLPEYITACTGMDALCQGIESFWSVKSTDESRKYSKIAIELSMSNLMNSVNNPDGTSRENMLMASNYAGRAINISQTTVAHAVSYPITSYFNIPHGHAVALTLPYFIEYNYEITDASLQDKRGIDFVMDRMDELINILDVDTVSEAREKLVNYMKCIHLETSFTALGIDKTGVELIIKNGFNPQRVKNNPRFVSESDLRLLVDKIK